MNSVKLHQQYIRLNLIFLVIMILLSIININIISFLIDCSITLLAFLIVQYSHDSFELFEKEFDHNTLDCMVNFITSCIIYTMCYIIMTSICGTILKIVLWAICVLNLC